MKTVIDNLLDLARRGELTRADFEPFTDPWRRIPITEWSDHSPSRVDLLLASKLRLRYNAEVSWAVFTREYLDSLANLVAGRKVLEVCAGTGVLQPLMRKRGVDWISTERRPRVALANADSWVRPLPVHLAVKQIPHDVVFASWIPYRSRIDLFLARQGAPLVIVGEGEGGCTGSELFWNTYGDRLIDPPKGFRDVTNWFGIHDYTSMLHWDRLP